MLARQEVTDNGLCMLVIYRKGSETKGLLTVVLTSLHTMITICIMGNGNKLHKSIMIKMQFMLTMSCLVLFMYMYFVVS